MSLQMENVTLTFPDGQSRVTAVDDVTMEVPTGFTALLGPSGSGKSSLLAVAATLMTPDRGSVRIGGVSVEGMSARERAEIRRTKIGIMFQAANLLPSLTVLEQLEVMGHLGGKGRISTDRARELLDRLGLGDLAKRLPSQLSGGQRQRVNLARALVHGPDVLLIDEPTSALDRERSEGVMELIREVTKEQQTATLLVTHDESLLHADDRVVKIVDGALDNTLVA